MVFSYEENFDFRNDVLKTYFTMARFSDNSE